jgi:hypothetical protein
MIVQDNSHSPVAGSFQRSQRPGESKQRRAVGCGEEVRLLRTFLAGPLEETARRYVPVRQSV